MLYFLYRLKSPVARLFLSAAAGLLSYYFIGLALRISAVFDRGMWTAYAWHFFYSLYGLSSLVTRIFVPDYEAGLEGPVITVPRGQDVGERLDFWMVLAFWTVLLGTLYFCFLRRRRERSNQTLQPTADRLEN